MRPSIELEVSSRMAICTLGSGAVAAKTGTAKRAERASNRVMGASNGPGPERILSDLVLVGGERFAELHGDELADAGLFHRDAVEVVDDLHGALVVGDENELRLLAHLAHHVVVA